MSNDSMGREVKCTRVIGANTYVIRYAYTPDGRKANESNAKWATRFWASVGVGAGTGGAAGAMGGAILALLYDDSRSEYDTISQNANNEWQSAGCSGNLKPAFK